MVAKLSSLNIQNASPRPEFERGCSDTESLTLAFAVSYGEVEMANDR
jgi:hypothetical protein